LAITNLLGSSNLKLEDSDIFNQKIAGNFFSTLPFCDWGKTILSNFIPPTKILVF